MRSRRLLAASAVAVASIGLASASTRALSFEERVEAQKAIDRVYYSHQVGTTRPFEEGVPRAVLEQKVRTYLKQSAALEKTWHTPVTALVLQRELERMASGTRQPERLRELYAALGNDPVLVAECLARPALVDRLTRSFFAFDRSVHGEARGNAETLRRQLVDREIDPLSDRPGRTVVTLTSDVSAEELGRWRAKVGNGEIGPLEETAQHLVVRVALDSKPDELRFASFVVRKRDWQGWWAGVEHDLDEGSVETVGSAEVTLPEPAGDSRAPAASCLPDDTWDNGSFDALPDGRSQHSAVWTGSMMIVWGGLFDYTELNTGARYDPATDSWALVSTTGAPVARGRHTAVWTGSRMIVWGGDDGTTDLKSGGQYDPVTDQWTATETAGAPTERSAHTAVWTGSRMVVWGGASNFSSLQSGGRYDPVTNTWQPTTLSGSPSARALHTAIWTGSRMVVWGGLNSQNSGGQYDPVLDVWTATSTVGAPEGRQRPTAVWTGSRMIVWGGANGSSTLSTGGRYDPATDSWTATSTTGAPAPRYHHAAVWTGTRMIVWGGGSFLLGSLFDTGGSYDPAANTWTPTSTSDAPERREGHTAIWTGSRMVVWGGNWGFWLRSGGRYDPATDSWTPTSIAQPGPHKRLRHTAVWTGSHMIVWGGSDVSTSLNLNTGGRYDPATDGWTETSLAGAPSERVLHSAVWSGSSMIVWGGTDSVVGLDSGGRYDPATDQWAPTSTAGAPTGRDSHTAVWTGSAMVVWGGQGGGFLGTGARYDPGNDLWTPVSSVDAPTARYAHTALWTGSSMVIWGGYGGAFLGTGGRYDPASDTWTPTSTVAAPTSRAVHTAVWTGSLMLVWGGSNAGGYLDTGGRYDPGNDTWTALPTFGGLDARHRHTAVWTGSDMVVWGGWNGSIDVDTGARYDPTTDGWTSTSLANAPASRNGHTAVWTGSLMIVWGGTGIDSVETGGRYALGQSVDDDEDGYSECDGDCNDLSDSIHPFAVEVCNGIDDDCSDVADDGIPAPAVLPLLTTGKTGSVTDLSWQPVPDATGYDVVKGDLHPLRTSNGDFATWTKACLGDDIPASTIQDAEIPPGSGGLWYLVRAVNACGGNGSYDEGGSQHADRDPGIAGAPNACP